MGIYALIIKCWYGLYVLRCKGLCVILVKGFYYVRVSQVLIKRINNRVPNSRFCNKFHLIFQSVIEICHRNKCLNGLQWMYDMN